MTVTNLQDRTRARIEDLFWLDEQDAGMPEVLDRLGLNEDTLQTFCDNHGLLALFQRARHRGHECTQQCPLALPARPDPVLFLGVHNRNIPPRDQRDWVTSVELQSEAGISYRQLDYWCRTGLLSAFGGNEPGSGSARAFSTTELERARAIRELLEAGVSLVTVRQHIDDYLGTGLITIGPITITRNTNQPEEAPA